METEVNLVSPGPAPCTCHADRTNPELVKLNNMTRRKCMQAELSRSIC